MARLYNPTPRDLTGQYAGMPYTIPKGKYVTIKGRREHYGVLHPEEIAAQLMVQLKPIGLCLVDEENEISEEQMKLDGLRRFRSFVHRNIYDFNQLNMKLASEGHSVNLVPNHLRILKKQLEDVERIIGKEGQDETGEDFVSQDSLEMIGSREKANFARAREVALQALRSGNPEGALAALSGNPEDAVTAGGGQIGTSHADESVPSEAASDPSAEFIDPPTAPNSKGGSRIPLGMRRAKAAVAPAL